MGIRSIIFRGKRTDNGEWAEGIYTRADGIYSGKEPLSLI